MDDIIAACMNFEGGELEDFPISQVPVWLLGRQYSTETELDDLRLDIVTRIWLTYRRNFPAIGNTGLTSDRGWGCMLRCGQMVLAEALLRINLGRDWRWHPEENIEIYLKIISMFEDDINQPFSLHQIVQLSVEDGKKVGEWFGPNTVAQILKKLTPFDVWNKTCVNVVMDNNFVIDEIKKTCYNENSRIWNPLIIFIPLRLGVSEVNPIYISSLQKCLKMPQSLGIIGGKPNHALYFLGYMGEEIVYLDPHTTQESGTLGTKDTQESKDLDLTYHCRNPLRMPFEYLDPSLALCFFCGSEKEFGDLCNRFQQELIDGEKAPIFTLLLTRPACLEEDSCCDVATGIDLEGHNLFSDDDDEEFEVLE